MQRLEISTTSDFELLYNDSGSGAKMDGAFYRPVSDDGFFVVGDYGQRGYGDPRGTVITVRENEPNTSKKSEQDPDRLPLLMPPINYVQIWNDKGSGAHMDGSFWQPVPPNGYVALGCVCQKGYDTPNLSKVYRCVRVDHVELGNIGELELIWNDQGSGADEDVSVYGIQATGVIYAQDNYSHPVGPIHIPRERRR